MKYLFDNCISYKFARMLACLRSSTKSLAPRDKFPENIADAELFRQLKKPRLRVCHERREAENQRTGSTGHQRGRFTSCLVRTFLVKEELLGPAKWIVTRWPTIDGYVQGVAKGTCAKLTERKIAPLQLVMRRLSFSYLLSVSILGGIPDLPTRP